MKNHRPLNARTKCVKGLNVLSKKEHEKLVESAKEVEI